MSNPVKDMTLRCVNCSAVARDISKERGRFFRRHPKLCIEKQNQKSEQAVFTQQLADGIRSVEGVEGEGVNEVH